MMYWALKFEKMCIIPKTKYLLITNKHPLDDFIIRNENLTLNQCVNQNSSHVYHSFLNICIIV